MKKLSLLVAVLITAIIFSSCSKNDDGDNGSFEWPKYEKLLKSIDDVEFSYDDQHRLTKVVYNINNSGSTVANYTYKNNTVTVSEDGDVVKFILDSNGYVIKEERKGEIYAQYQYSNGHISKTTWGDDDWMTYTWENGNLTEIEGYATYTYSNVTNKLSVNIFDFDWGLTEYAIFDDGDTFTNFKGTSPKNYPVSDDNNRTASYTYDSDGYPTEITITDTYRTYTLTLTYY